MIVVKFLTLFKLFFIADDLKVVDVPIMSKCKYVHDQESQSICAGETFGTRDACQVRTIKISII